MFRFAVVVATLMMLFPVSLHAQPSIVSDGTGVVNASSYLADIAQGSWFVVFGTGLGPASLTVASGVPFPTELAGSRVTFTPAGGGAPIECRLWYTYATQLAALLPSTTPRATTTFA